MNSPKLVLIRHGVTVDNASGRLMGRNDAPLTPETKREATALGQSTELQSILEATPVIWASPLPRAFDTAKLIVGNRDITVRKVDALVERDFGVYNGRMLDELWQSGDQDWRRAEGEHSVRPERGESLADVESRAFRFIVNLHTTESTDKTIMLVGHSTVWRLVSAALHDRRRFPLVEKIAGPLSMQVFERDAIERLAPILAELDSSEREGK